MEATMHVSKWGNSLAVRLPKKLVEELGVAEGDEVKLTAAADKTIEVEKIDRRKQFLAELAKFNWPLPEGYKFDRDEANER
jgi:antitoxin MazE